MDNVYSRLNQARIELQRRELKKSGRNKFANYSYFELGDFLPVVQDIFSEIGLCGVVSYGTETASLSIFDCEQPEQCIEIHSPMSSAALKGAHDIQNLGAVQTYLRRYLWVTAMEIVEHDELDASLGAPGREAKKAAEEPKGRKPYAPGNSVAPHPTDSVQRLLEIKVHDLGITPFGAQTLLKICDADSFANIAESKANSAYQKVNAEMIERYNAGRNGKNEQILEPPIVDKAKNTSIQELERAAAALFDDSEA